MVKAIMLGQILQEIINMRIHHTSEPLNRNDLPFLMIVMYYLYYSIVESIQNENENVHILPFLTSCASSEQI